MKRPVLTVRSLVASHTHNRKNRRGGKLPAKVEFEGAAAEIAVRAIEELYTFIGHVRSLTSCPLSKKVGLFEYFDSVESVLDEIMRLILSGRDVGSWSYGEDLEIQSLEDVLDNMWSPTWAKARILDDEDEAIDLLVILIEFWLGEIRNRGYAIHGLLTGSECLDTVNNSLQRLQLVNYPPVYGGKE